MLTVLTLLTLWPLLFQLAQSQLIASLPQCIQDCIDQSEDENCSISDIKCLCRASAGNFLPNIITCMHGNCDNNLDNNLLLMPLQLACQLVGAPIPDSAIQNAENVGSSLATQVTKTVTMGGPSTTEGGFEATTTVSEESPSVSAVTVTRIEGGTVIAVVYPVTEWRTTTMSGSASTLTSTESPSSSYSADSSSGSSESTTIETTTLAAASTSSSQTSASKTKPMNPDLTNSAPFKDTQSGAVKERVSNWLGMVILLGMGILWF
jgi:hypothetical protein